MLIWFLLALGAAVTNSISQAYQNYLLTTRRFSKTAISFYFWAFGSCVLFALSLFRGIPVIDERFWFAAFVTATINVVAFPITLRAYQLGEFSSVYSMILLTPIFLLFTSFIFLKEVPTLFGIMGVMFVIAGLIVVHVTSAKTVLNGKSRKDIARGNMYGIAVALLFSISANFDKLSARYSDAIFAGAVIAAMASLMTIMYLIFSQNLKDLSPLKKERGEIFPLLVSGCIYAVTLFFHNTALLMGFVAYTIAVKRLGVLFGVVWGNIFFREKWVWEKFFGVMAAIAGVLLIIFAG